MIIFDTETTSLTMPEAANIDKQPRIIEFAAIRVDPDSLLEIKGRTRLESFINPGVPIPADAARITGISDVMVKSAPRFSTFYEQLWKFFLGEDTIVAHNCSFDVAVLRHELTRIDQQFRFPWPPRQLCTVELTMGLKGHRLNLGALHELATGKEHVDKHRAMTDVEALLTCVRWMRKRKMI